MLTLQSAPHISFKHLCTLQKGDAWANEMADQLSAACQVLQDASGIVEDTDHHRDKAESLSREAMQAEQ